MNPVHLEDSIDTEKENSPKPSTSSNLSTYEVEQQGCNNSHTERFKNVRKKLKPLSKSDAILEEIHIDRQLQAEQLSLLKAHLQKSEEQRQRFLDILERAFSKKRKRENDSDSD